ncbi:MAG: cytochrome c oxidase subunit 3 [Phycisphaeraceae bacterium]
MRFFGHLTEKPWLTAQVRIDDLHEGVAFSLPRAELALRVFLAVVTVLFMLLIIAYAERMVHEDWRPAPPLRLLWLNTAMLVLSSVALHWAKVSIGRAESLPLIRRREMEHVKWELNAAGVFGSAFLGGQIVAWAQLDSMPFFDITHPAIAFFYLITGLHALHMLGGLVAWGRTAARMNDSADLSRLRLSIKLCAVYWHFLLVVWLVLFGLLFSGNDNLGTLLAICGIR